MGRRTGELLQALGSRDPVARSEAIAALSELPEDEEAQEGLEEAAATLATPSLSEQLAALLRSESPAARAAAALALAGRGARTADKAPDIAELLSDAAEDLTWLPLQIGGCCPRPPMGMRKPRCAALVALGALGSERHLPAMARLLADGDWEVRFCALEGIGAMGEAGRPESSAVADLLEDAIHPVRAKACSVLAALRAESEVDRVAELLQDKAQAVRAEALLALGGLGAEAGGQYSGEMAKLLSDESNIVRGCAAAALASLGAASQPYASAVAGLLYDDLPDVRAQACIALSQMGVYGAAFAEDLADLASQEPDEAVRQAAAAALERMRALTA